MIRTTKDPHGPRKYQLLAVCLCRWCCYTWDTFIKRLRRKRACRSIMWSWPWIFLRMIRIHKIHICESGRSRLFITTARLTWAQIYEITWCKTATQHPGVSNRFYMRARKNPHDRYSAKKRESRLPPWLPGSAFGSLITASELTLTETHALPALSGQWNTQASLFMNRLCSCIFLNLILWQPELIILTGKSLVN